MNKVKLSNTVTKLVLLLIGLNLTSGVLLQLEMQSNIYDLVNLLNLLFPLIITAFLYQLFSQHYSNQKWLMPTILSIFALVYSIFRITPFSDHFTAHLSNDIRLSILMMVGLINATALIWLIIILFKRNKDTHLERGSRLFLASTFAQLIAIFALPVSEFYFQFMYSFWVFTPINLLQSMAVFMLFWSELKFEPIPHQELRGHQEDDINFEFEEK